MVSELLISFIRYLTTIICRLGKSFKTTFPTRPFEDSSESTGSVPSPHHSREQSKESKTSNITYSTGTGSQSYSSGSNQNPPKVVIGVNERKKDPHKGVLQQSGPKHSGKVSHRTVMFDDHSPQSSVNTQSDASHSSYPSSAGKLAMTTIASGNQIAHRCDTPPLIPAVYVDSKQQQPHQLNLMTNQFQAIRNSLEIDDFEDVLFQKHNPANIHPRSRSDELSEHYVTMHEIQSNLKQSQLTDANNSNMKKKQKTRSQERLTSFASLFKSSTSKKEATPSAKEASNDNISQNLAGTVFSDNSGHLRGLSASPTLFINSYGDLYQDQSQKTYTKYT